ncbi:MAG TPA: hypothetical protein VFA80_12550 [Xanthobacteraceae bacterium]|nr:hypothetical protein [Xanthobacteraceae bacterium]
MSSDRSAFAFERLDVAADEVRSPAAPARDLAELASALAEVEALLAAGAGEGPDAGAAVERIADIAFVLHEREVEPSLCDALDAAMRDLNEANAHDRANAQRAQEAVELLHALGRRLDAMMAAQAEPQALASADAVQGAGDDGELECADEFPAPARLFDADVAEDGAFAQTVAALAEALPEHSDADPAQSRYQVADSSSAPEVVAHSQTHSLAHSDVQSEQAETAPGAWIQAENPTSEAGEDPVPDSSPASSIGVAAAPAIDAYGSIDPDEDPGDLFEPAPDVRQAADAAPPAMSANSAEAAAPAASLAPQWSGSSAAAPADAASRSAANDPLAPIRALSEEELIALFS